MSRAPAVVLAAAALFALAGCGGSGEGSTSTAPHATTSASTDAKSQVSGAQTKPVKPEPKGDPGPEGSPAASARHDSATGAAQFKTKGGDNSIQESGSEAASTELTQAAAVLHGYLDARAAGEWKKACSFMAGGVTRSLTQLGAGAQGGGGAKAPGCSELIASLSAGLPPSALHEAAIADVGALRTHGNNGFLLFHGSGDSDYFMPMVREGSSWKVGAVAPSPLS